jgi:hypothetical protein
MSRYADESAGGEQRTSDVRGEIVRSQVNADAGKPRDVDPVVDEYRRADLARPPVGFFDGSEELAVGEVFLTDLEKPDSGAEEPPRDVGNVLGARRDTRCDGVDRRELQL